MILICRPLWMARSFRFWFLVWHRVDHKSKPLLESGLAFVQKCANEGGFCCNTKHIVPPILNWVNILTIKQSCQPLHFGCNGYAFSALITPLRLIVQICAKAPILRSRASRLSINQSTTAAGHALWHACARGRASAPFLETSASGVVLSKENGRQSSGSFSWYTWQSRS